MDSIYQGDMRVARIAARVALTPLQGDVETEYDLENIGTASLRHELTTGGRELRRFDLRRPDVARAPRRAAATVEQRRQLLLSPRERMILDEDTMLLLPSAAASPSFVYRPILFADGRQVLNRVEAYDVTIALPRAAKRLIFASVPPAALRSTPDGLVCEFRQANVYPLPISIKWTEADADIAISRTARLLPGNVFQVTITLTNRGGSAVSKLLVEDDYSAADATPTEAGRLSIVAETEKDPRLVFRQEVNLSPHGSATLSYSIRSRKIQLRLPRTRAMLDGALVAVSTDEPDLNFAPHHPRHAEPSPSLRGGASTSRAAAITT